MTARHQLSLSDVSRPYFRQRQDPVPARKYSHGLRWMPHVHQMMIILVMLGAVMLLGAQPAAAAASITEFKVPSPGIPQGITAGSDGALWFTLFYDNEVGRVTTKGSFTAFPYNDSSGGYPYQITAGPDGNLWFTDRAREIVKMTTSGKFTSFTIPTSNASTDDITKGPDGNLWFTLDGSQSARIGRITPSGTITLFTLPNPNDYLYMSGIATGQDGNLWFTYQDFTTKVNAIGRITTSGSVTLTTTPTANSGPSLIDCN